MKQTWLQKTLKWMELPEDLDPRVPRITILGRDTLAVENLSGMRRCTKSQVSLLTEAGVLLVEGEELCVKELGESRILITGRLLSCTFEE